MVKINANPSSNPIFHIQQYYHKMRISQNKRCVQHSTREELGERRLSRQSSKQELTEPVKVECLTVLSVSRRDYPNEWSKFAAILGWTKISWNARKTTIVRTRAPPAHRASRILNAAPSCRLRVILVISVTFLWLTMPHNWHRCDKHAWNVHKIKE